MRPSISNEFASGDTEINREVALFLGRLFFSSSLAFLYGISLFPLLTYSVTLLELYLKEYKMVSPSFEKMTQDRLIANARLFL